MDSVDYWDRGGEGEMLCVPPPKIMGGGGNCPHLPSLRLVLQPQTYLPVKSFR